MFLVNLSGKNILDKSYQRYAGGLLFIALSSPLRKGSVLELDTDKSKIIKKKKVNKE
jgi:hypothetical protein